MTRLPRHVAPRNNDGDRLSESSLRHPDPEHSEGEGSQERSGDPSVARLRQDDNLARLRQDDNLARLRQDDRSDSSLESDLSEIKKEQDKVRKLTDRLSAKLHRHPESSLRHPDPEHNEGEGSQERTGDSSAMPQNDMVLPPQNDMVLPPQNDVVLPPRNDIIPVKKPNYKNTFERLQQDPDFRNILISGVNAVLHTAATVTNSLVKDDSRFKILNEIFDKSALWCTKYVAPITSYGWSAYEAIRAKQPVKAFIKLIPPSFLPFVGDANIDTVYGSSTGFNQPYDLAVERIKEKEKVDPDFAKRSQEMRKTHLGNAKLFWETFSGMCKEFVKGKMPYKEAIYFVNCSMILAGALPMMLFDRKARDTLPAKVLGTMRSIGGLIGDYAFVTQEWGNLHKLSIGGLCGISAVASIVKRFVKSESVARVLIHLGAALDVTAYALWNAFNSGKQNEGGVNTPKVQTI